MNGRVAVVLAASILVAFLAREPVAGAAPSECTVGSDVFSAASACYHPGTETLGYVADHPDHTISVTMTCRVDLDPCTSSYVVDCEDVGLTGQVYDVREDAARLRWQACLTPTEAREVNASGGG